jgi:branched-chain amino acid aminotransferase
VQAHLRRLYQAAKALDINIDLAPRQLQAMLQRCLDANGMRGGTGVHVRLIVSRGLKSTPCQNPRTTLGHPTIVIIPEWKVPEAEVAHKACLECESFHSFSEKTQYACFILVMPGLRSP